MEFFLDFFDGDIPELFIAWIFGIYCLLFIDEINGTGFEKIFIFWIVFFGIIFLLRFIGILFNFLNERSFYKELEEKQNQHQEDND